MNIKKEVYNRIIEVLKKELNRCNDKIYMNKYHFKKLSEEQTILKRERVELNRTMNEITGKVDSLSGIVRKDIKRHE